MSTSVTTPPSPPDPRSAAVSWGYPPRPPRSPQFPTQLGQIIQDIADHLGMAVDIFGRAYLVTLGRAYSGIQDALVAADVLPDPGPTDPKERALWLRQHRNTGPSRDVVHQRRPRTHPGAHP